MSSQSSFSSAEPPQLHGYYRSSASWRVRIALALKHLPVEQVTHHLRRGDQKAADYLQLNPQGLVPALQMGTDVLTQSLAICEYLEETHPTPNLLPGDAVARAHIRAFAQAIACEIHPVQNLKILRRLREFGLNEEAVNHWACAAINDGLGACALLLPIGGTGPFCFGAAPTLADICLVPQLYNARRFGVDLQPWPRLLAIETACLALPAFAATAPEQQPDAE